NTSTPCWSTEPWITRLSAVNGKGTFTSITTSCSTRFIPARLNLPSSANFWMDASKNARASVRPRPLISKRNCLIFSSLWERACKISYKNIRTIKSYPFRAKTVYILKIKNDHYQPQLMKYLKFIIPVILLTCWLPTSQAQQPGIQTESADSLTL